MGEFLKAFIPTITFMLVPLMIPLFAVAVGAARDALDGARVRVDYASASPSRKAADGAKNVVPVIGVE